MRHAPSEEDDARFEEIARNAAKKFPQEESEDFDILYFLSEGKTFDQIADEMRIAPHNVPLRIAHIFERYKLGIPFPPRSPEAREILKLVFELI